MSPNEVRQTWPGLLHRIAAN